MAASSVLRYDEHVTSDEDFLGKVLSEKFSLSHLRDAAANDGFEISDEDWHAYLTEIDVPKSRMHILVHGADDQITEISAADIEKVSGGSEYDGEWDSGWDTGYYVNTFDQFGGGGGGGYYGTSRAGVSVVVWAVAIVAAGAAVNVAVYANAVVVTLVAVAGAAVAVIVAVVL